MLAEIFRERGYSGTSLSEITLRTGLGKGSLYHLFPGGKEEMARVVLDDVSDWFEANVFRPLRQTEDPAKGIDHMFHAVNAYFEAGRRTCLVGAFALDDSRDRFANEIRKYFSDWVNALAEALKADGLSPGLAMETAEEVVSGIQGALVLTRSKKDAGIFARSLKRLRARTTIQHEA